MKKFAVESCSPPRLKERMASSAIHPAARSIALLGCLCLIPSPALPVGQTIRLQLGTGALLLCLILRIGRMRPGIVGQWLLLSVPAVVAAAVGFIEQSFAIETLKISLVWIVSTFHMAPGTPDDETEIAELAKGLSAGMLLNGVAGVLQLLTIPSDRYPLWSWHGLGQTPVSVAKGFQSGAGIFGVRVFGLFSEPSDMTASIGHWWLLLFGGRLGLLAPGALAQFCVSRLCGAALIAGAALMMLSRSGHIFVVAAGVAALVLMGRQRRRTAPPKRFTNGLFMLFVFSMVCVGFYDVKKRVDAGEEIAIRHGTGSSWTVRASSIVEVTDLWANGSPREFVFGLGYEGGAIIKASTGHNIWSVVGKSVLSFGLLALLGWCAIALCIVHSLSCSRARGLGLVFAGTLFVALTVTTSYETLISPWLGLGLLLSWRNAFSLA